MGTKLLDLEAEGTGDGHQRIAFGRMEPVAAVVHRLAGDRLREGASADPVARLEHHDGRSGIHEPPGGRQPGHACTDYDDVEHSTGSSRT